MNILCISEYKQICEYIISFYKNIESNSKRQYLNISPTKLFTDFAVRYTNVSWQYEKFIFCIGLFSIFFLHILNSALGFFFLLFQQIYFVLYLIFFYGLHINIFVCTLLCFYFLYLYQNIYSTRGLQNIFTSTDFYFHDL